MGYVPGNFLARCGDTPGVLSSPQGCQGTSRDKKWFQASLKRFYGVYTSSQNVKLSLPNALIKDKVALYIPVLKKTIYLNWCGSNWRQSRSHVESKHRLLLEDVCVYCVYSPASSHRVSSSLVYVDGYNRIVIRFMTHTNTLIGMKLPHPFGISHWKIMQQQGFLRGCFPSVSWFG